MKRPYSICFLGYENLSDIARKVIQEGSFQDADVLLLECTPDNLSEQLEYAVQHGCEAFIAGSSNAAEFRRISNMPLTEIQIQIFDYVLALKKAFAIGELPVLFTYRFSKAPDISLLQTVFDRRFLYITYEDTYDLTQKLSGTDGDVVIGASLVTSLAQSYGKKSVFLYPGSRSVEDAFRRCQSSMRSLYTHNRNQVIYSSIINNDVNGIIFANEKGDVILYNPAAEKLTGVPAQQIRKRNFEDLFPWAGLKEIMESDDSQLRRTVALNGQYVELTSIKVSVNGNVLGALMLLSHTPAPLSAPAEPDKKAGERNALQFSFSQFTCVSAQMAQAIEDAKAYSVHPEPCVIVGEAGTGKVTFASAMHAYGPRSMHPIRLVNCATIEPRYAAQYFWGREDFSGQVVNQGILERCDHGTLVLERIADADPVVQDCLAHALKTRQLQRLNGTRSIPLDVRLITLVSPQEWDSLQQRLTPELYYALTPFILRLPALRERPEDISPLFEGFVNDNLSLRTNSFSASKSLSTIFREYSWPGNLSELKNVACRFAFQIEKLGKLSPYMQRRTLISAIGEDELFYDITRPFGDLNALKDLPGELLRLNEKLKHVLAYNNDQIASRLNISRTTLWRLLNNP